jgi:nucleotidyltransferase substrate binding protein (TIGR01987 family)
MAWKALKRYLDYLGIEAKAPRNVFKEAFSQGIIIDENVWLDMIEQRNLTSHIYDEFQIQDILNKKEYYKKAFIELKTKLESELSSK